MLQILGYIFLIAIAIILIKFGYALLMRCCALGILAFLIVGCITGALSIVGKISSSIAWTISKWAFYVGTAINIVEVISHPLEAIEDAWDFTTDTDYTASPVETYNNDVSSGGSGNTSTSSSSPSLPPTNTSDDDTEIYIGRRCCGNCRWNRSPNHNDVICSLNPAGANNSVNDVCGDYVKM